MSEDTVMKEAFASLGEEQIAFICEEFSIEAEDLANKTEEELDEIYEALCDVEVDELCEAEDGELSERGEIVSSIVTMVGNEIAKAQGDYDEEDFESFFGEE